MRNFFVNFSGLGQKAEGFGTLFLRSGFLPKWTQTDQFFGHHLKGLPPDSRNDFRVLLSAQVAGSVGSNSVQSTFEADQTQVCPSFPGGFLVGRFDQIVGDQTHDEIFAQRRGQRKEGVRRLFLLLIMTTHAPSHGRSPRIEFPGAIYYVLSRGNRWTNLFTDDDDR